MAILRTFIHCFTLAFVTLLITTSIPVEAGLFSSLSKLGKSANKIDGSDVGLPNSFHFKDDLINLPEGSVAEISLANGKWIAKTPDGKQYSIDEFIDQFDDSKISPTLILAESNVPKSLATFDDLPPALNIQIHTRNGKKYTLQRTSSPPSLRYDNIEIPITEAILLDKVIWQLQRPVMTQKVRFVQLSKDIDADLPPQIYSSKPVIDSLGLNQLVEAIENMRLETLILSAHVEKGFVVYGGQRVPIKLLEKAAAKSDVNLLILGSDKPKKALQRVATKWKILNDNGDNIYDSVADFYNRFAPEDSNSPMRINISKSGELQTAFHIENKSTPVSIEDAGTKKHTGLLPLHVLIESVKVVQPSESRLKELDRRIHPLIPSSIQYYLIISFIFGAFTTLTSWHLYKKIWNSPTRSSSSNIVSFVGKYSLHRLCFIIFYLPLLGIFSPIYVIVKWTLTILNFLLIRPARWLYARLT